MAHKENTSKAAIKAFLEFFADKIDYETELVPFLLADEKIVFDERMQNRTDLTDEKFEKKYNLHTEVKTIIRTVFSKIKRVYDNKLYVQEIEARYGGSESLEQMSFMVSKEQQDIINDYILNLDPLGGPKLAKRFKVTLNELDHKKRYLLDKLDTIYERKKSSEEFVPKYGGEDFLVHDFGSNIDTLFGNPDRAEKMLLFGLMDYHYLANDFIIPQDEDEADDVECGETANDYVDDDETELDVNVNEIKISVKKKLKEYIKRKNFIDALLDKIKVEKFDEYIKTLKALKPLNEVILMEHVIAFAPKTKRQIARENDTYVEKVAKLRNDIVGELNELAGIDPNSDEAEIIRTTLLRTKTRKK